MFQGLSRLVPMVRGLIAFGKLVRNPANLEPVYALVEMTEDPRVMQGVLDHLLGDPVAAAAIKARTMRGPIDLRALGALPAGTLGRAFADFLGRNRLDPADLEYPKPVTNDREYLAAHLFEAHDVWHVVTGFEPEIAGEIGVQAFTYAQVVSPLPGILLAAGFLNTVILGLGERDLRMRSLVRGWLMGRRAATLFGRDWASLWAAPLAELRAQLGVDFEALDGLLPGPDQEPAVDLSLLARAA